jgi:hypothetical protein
MHFIGNRGVQGRIKRTKPYFGPYPSNIKARTHLLLKTNIHQHHLPKLSISYPTRTYLIYTAKMQFKSLVLSVFVATASASWVQLCGPSGCTDTGGANDNTCIGPVRGTGTFTFRSYGSDRGTMSIFTDACSEWNAAYCTDCNSVSWTGQGKWFGSGFLYGMYAHCVFRPCLGCFP